jgi:hypothetical protein
MSWRNPIIFPLFLTLSRKGAEGKEGCGKIAWIVFPFSLRTNLTGQYRVS